jgi:transposase
MGAPYSLDLRQRAVGAVADGMSCAEAAEHYQVSHSSAIRWTRRQAETGSPGALPWTPRTQIVRCPPRRGNFSCLLDVPPTVT